MLRNGGLLQKTFEDLCRVGNPARSSLEEHRTDNIERRIRKQGNLIQGIESVQQKQYNIGNHSIHKVFKYSKSKVVFVLATGALSHPKDGRGNHEKNVLG